MKRTNYKNNIKKVIAHKTEKTVLLEFLEGKPKVKCAILGLQDKDDTYSLKCGYTLFDWSNFLTSIDIDKNFWGMLWFEDGTWAKIEESVHKSQWWKHQTIPEIPMEIS